MHLKVLITVLEKYLQKMCFANLFPIPLITTTQFLFLDSNICMYIVLSKHLLLTLKMFC